MKWVIAYIGAEISFGALDAIWLTWAGPNFYRPAIGELLADSFRVGPAAIFYLFYIAGMVWFAIKPGLAHGAPSAALNGALLGALCYATYDMTNQATLKIWPTYVTIADICWGAFATSIAATAATILVQKLG